MRQIDILLSQYGESHQNGINKFIHWICVPAIMFSIFGLLYAIPFPFVEEKSWALNWGGIALFLVLMYYIKLSIPMFIGFIGIGSLMLVGNQIIYESLGNSNLNLLYASLATFGIAWVFQFIGHHIEGKKPSFIDDVQFLLVGPAWLMHFVFKKLGVKY
jgi:uncharacterized membrane protein YGL010W